jgi:hypothetical protein
VCREIQLSAGWNLVSWNVAYSVDISTLIDMLNESTCVDVVLGFDQGGLTYDPDLPEYSTLQNVDYYHGYWFKMNCDASFEVCGPPIGTDEYIAVSRDWNLVSYWPTIVFPVEYAFLSILGNLEVVLGYDNGGLTWTADHPEMNTLTELTPGSGYWVNVSTQDLLTYPGFEPPSLAKAKTFAEIERSDMAISRQWMSLYGAEIALDGTELPENSLIEILTPNGIRCGADRYANGRLKFTPVYGFDGFDRMSVSLPRIGDSLALYVNGERAYPSLTWKGHGVRERIDRLRTSDNSELPKEFALQQNYPNPFNPVTCISFSVPKRSLVRLDVFNILGQKVATLVDQDLDAGTHSVFWDASDDASGVYFYRLRAGDFHAERKMLLIK